MRTRHPLPSRPGRRRLTAAPALAAAVLSVLVLSGCSGGGAEDGAAEPAQPLSTAGTAAASSDPSATADPSAAPSEQVVTSMTTFQSPTGNIACYLAPVEGQGPYARCDITEKSWTAEPPADGCAGDWGGASDARGSVGVGDREAAVLCATDTVVAAGAEVLQYGSTIRMGDLSCTVDPDTGVSCQNGVTGKGFSVSKAKHVLR